MQKIKLIACFIGSYIIHLLGGWDIWLTSLCIVMVLDILTGLLKAILIKSNKSSSGGLSSSAMYKGGIKKLVILILVALGTVLDKILTPDNAFIRVVIVSYYIANESLSVLENVGACGLPLPKVLYKILDSLKNENT